jgi:hypothetical protein
MVAIPNFFPKEDATTIVLVLTPPLVLTEFLAYRMFPPTEPFRFTSHSSAFE